MKSLGIDIGSTTVKLVVTEGTKIVYEKYRRHFSRAWEKTLAMLQDIESLVKEEQITVCISGSAGLGLSQSAHIPFVQEVYATGNVVKRLAPDTNVVIELGGEDAKIIFFDGGMDQRMNGTCAGGTGAFIDQMAVLLDMTVEEMDKAALQATQCYDIASRCGVFAKSDIQPLLNQGAAKADVAASIYRAVVNQTIGGLAQGRKIQGKVLFLGGPLYYCKGLRKSFREVLGLDETTGVLPTYARFAVALGAALYSQDLEPMEYQTLLEKIKTGMQKNDQPQHRLAPLFDKEEAYHEFMKRHQVHKVEQGDITTYSGKAYLGIDCGSTTTKLVLIGEQKEILYTYYGSNKGNPVDIVREQLARIYQLAAGRSIICGGVSTGYGEELICHAFGLNAGIVETMAHYTAARHFCPEVDFILDIGGQDIKCFRIHNHAIDSIMLNEACSSGCGSFLETFAKSMGYTTEEFAREALGSKEPVDLGSRCTVFMNSSVKQSQKEGASVADISAGLSISVVKNALYKVIRANSAKELGERIVVQGGTFLNDAVLRAFEQETGAQVIRPSIAGLMGAYGAALYAMRYEETELLDEAGLESFVHESSTATCNGCTNHCRLTVNRFPGGRKFISGNQCQRGLGKSQQEDLPNLYEWKRQYLASLTGGEGPRGTVGLPLALGMYELAPLWHGIFTALGYQVIFSKPSTRGTYLAGQFTIPSDTVCYPAKIMHGHIQELCKQQTDAIFYPCLTWNLDEGAGDNHYNCPIVAYYSELLYANVEELRQRQFLYPYLSIENEKALSRTLYPYMKSWDSTLSKREVKKAVAAGYRAYKAYRAELQKKTREALTFAREKQKRVMVLAGRPYHVDFEICHGIDRLANSLGFVVLTEDGVSELTGICKTQVLDQWTFHSRLYKAAAFAATQPDVAFVQLVSFGCGLDAVTTDEARSILEKQGKLYTQIKIDEITNIGAVKIRLRSLLAALESEERG